MKMIYKDRRRPLVAPSCRPDPPEKVVCSRFIECDGCTYPSHGFLCWGKDGRCMRTIIRDIRERENARRTKND